MNAIRIHTQLDSTTLHLPEVQPMVGKQVEIIVLEDPPRRAATEDDWNEFFATAGTGLIEADLVQEYRDFDRRSRLPPPL